MPLAGNYRKRMVKSMAARALGDQGGLVSDDEMTEARQNMQQVADAGIKAQQANINRAAMGGMQNAAQFQQAAQSLSQTSAQGAIQAGGEANKLQAALRERRKAEALQGVTALNESNRALLRDYAAAGTALGAGSLGAPKESVAGVLASAATRRPPTA